MEVGYGRMSQREIVLIAKTFLSVKKKIMAFFFFGLTFRALLQLTLEL
jgi:hypothetical protein